MLLYRGMSDMITVPNTLRVLPQLTIRKIEVAVTGKAHMALTRVKNNSVKETLRE